MKMIEVTCAIIEKEGKVLATRRAHGSHLGGFWEFPGGKIEPGETDQDCVVREIAEELSITIEIVKSMEPVEHHYPEKCIRLLPFVCRMTTGHIILKDHSAFCWLELNKLQTLEWAAADKIVLENYLNSFIPK